MGVELDLRLTYSGYLPDYLDHGAGLLASLTICSRDRSIEADVSLSSGQLGHIWGDTRVTGNTCASLIHSSDLGPTSNFCDPF